MDPTLKYAEQVGWLTNRTDELNAAMEFQTERAQTLQHLLNEANGQLAAKDELAKLALCPLEEEHASALQAMERSHEEALMSINDQLADARQHLLQHEEHAEVGKNTCAATAGMQAA
jgi:hypothetical protein